MRFDNLLGASQNNLHLKKLIITKLIGYFVANAQFG
jgi:hypothetical protein